MYTYIYTYIEIISLHKYIYTYVYIIIMEFADFEGLVIYSAVLLERPGLYSLRNAGLSYYGPVRTANSD